VTRNNTRLLFAPGAQVIAKQGSFHGISDCLVSVYVSTNLTISGYGATWRMWREEYNNSALYAHSEGRHGLNLMGCRNCIVEGLLIEESGGDGISVWKGHEYVPGDAGADYCTPAMARANPACACVNLLVRDVVCDRNYRQGMSVMLAENLLVVNSVFSNTAGTPPAAGLVRDPRPRPPSLFLSVSLCLCVSVCLCVCSCLYVCLCLTCGNQQSLTICTVGLGYRARPSELSFRQRQLSQLLFYWYLLS
jgi:hypothetical protein